MLSVDEYLFLEIEKNSLKSKHLYTSNNYRAQFYCFIQENDWDMFFEDFASDFEDLIGVDADEANGMNDDVLWNLWKWILIPFIIR